MSKPYNYRTALLSLFLSSMGDGFYDTICEYYPIKIDNLKKKIMEMKKGEFSSFEIVWKAVYETIGAMAALHPDNKELYCPEYASEKYYYTLSLMMDYFFYSSTANNSSAKDNEYYFPYESFEDSLSYLIGSNFYFSNRKEFTADSICDDRDKFIEDYKRYNAGLKESDPKRYEEDITNLYRKYRNEFCNASRDVRLNENQTFYKWPIKEFYSQISDKSKADKIIKEIFGKNPDDESLTTTFSKLKYEKGKRNWTTFKKLFQNELKNDGLMDLLGRENENDIAAFQIFQSRMSIAYFLENLCASLPEFVGEENAEKIRQIISCKEGYPKASDFLIPDHNEKSKNFKEKVLQLIGDYDLNPSNFEEKCACLDPSCPATKSARAYIKLLNPRYLARVDYNQIDSIYTKLMEECAHNPQYLEVFTDYNLDHTLNGFRITADLGNNLWRCNSFTLQ